MVTDKQFDGTFLDIKIMETVVILNAYYSVKGTNKNYD